MKNIFYLLISVLIFLPLMVNADMGAPMIERYKASVTNPDGAALYEYDSNKGASVPNGNKIPYGTEVTIEYEDEDEACPNNYKGCVKIKDITPVEKEYKVTLKDLEASETAIVLKDLEIKKGPAEAYESTGVKIKAGTSIEIRFFKAIKDENPWVYVEYNGVNGFINTLNASVAYSKIKDVVYMTNKESKVKNPVTGEVVGTIEANKIINGEFYQLDPWSRSYYLKLSSISGIISYNDLTYKSDEPHEYTLLKKMDLHETSEANSKIIGSVDEGTTFTSYYSDDEYSDIAIYYNDGNIKGWLVYTYNYEDESQNPVKAKYDVSVPPVVEEEKEGIYKTLSTNEKIYISIAVAFILLLTGVVTIILVNKRK